MYSGRRGVHAWVADKRDLSQQARVAIVEYLTLVKVGGGGLIWWRSEGMNGLIGNVIRVSV